MGEVYKARDTRLDRTVAVKVLPEEIAKREDLLARFEREARAGATLNHLNLCSLFGGYTVAERIGKGKHAVGAFDGIAVRGGDFAADGGVW